ncbi:hypothetical protein VTN02DRAFT_3470 [Thermoascus thermophilus]
MHDALHVLQHGTVPSSYTWTWTWTWTSIPYQQIGLRWRMADAASRGRRRNHTFWNTFHPPIDHRAATKAVLPASITTPQKTCSLVKLPCTTSGTRAPPIGLPVRAAKEMMAKKVPLRTPIWRTSEICATRAGPRETKAPEPKPYRAEKTMMGALEREGSQSARTRMDER